MKTVRDILKVKGTDVWCVEPDATVFDALQRMAEKEVGALVVTEGAQVVGLISERDYARKVILHGRASPTTLVKEIMTSHVVYTHIEQSIEECMALVTEKRIRHLPVMADGKLVGVISIGDLVKSIISPAVHYRATRTLHQRVKNNKPSRFAAGVLTPALFCGVL